MRPGLPSPSDGGSPKMGWIDYGLLGSRAASAYAGLHTACVYGAHVTSSNKSQANFSADRCSGTRSKRPSLVRNLKCADRTRRA